jgi:hypothetical protein
MPRGNPQNLIKNSERSPEQLREQTRNGGLKSGETRRRQKSLRELFEAFGESKPNPVVKEQFEKVGIQVNDDDTMLTCMFKWAGVKSVAKGTKIGDLLKFFEVYGKYTGQEPAKELNITGDVGTKIRYIEPDEYKAVQEHIDSVIGDTNDDPD